MDLEKKRPWADLPLEILTLVLSRLFSKDIAIVRSVCTQWRLTPPPRVKHIEAPVSEIVKHPFLVRFRRDIGSSSSYCQLYSPAYSKSYLVDCLDKLGHAQIHCSNHGWLLLSTQRTISSGEFTFYFFYHPSTGSVVKLPRLPKDYCFMFNRMGFSAPPTSPDCMVFGLVDMFGDSYVHIAYIKRGDPSWTRYGNHSEGESPNKMMNEFTCRNFAQHDKGMRFELKGNRCKFPPIPHIGVFEWSYYSSPVFHNGAFYCLSKFGTLGAFNSDSKRSKWRILNSRIHNAFAVEIFDQVYLTESCKGELLSIVVKSRGESESIRVLKFHEHLNMWQTVGSLDNQVVFLSPTSCVVRSCDELQVKGLENTIHFPRFNGEYNAFYSISTKKFHSFEGGYTSENLCDTKILLNCTWMVPDFRNFSTQQLDWSLKLDGTVYEENHAREDHMIHQSFFTRHLPTKSNYSTCKSIIHDEHGGQLRTMEQEEEDIGKPWIVFRHGNDEVTFTDLASGSQSKHAIEARIRDGNWISGSGHGRLLLVNIDTCAGDCILLDTSSMTIDPLPKWDLHGTFMHDCGLIYLSPKDSKLVAIVFCRIQKEEEKKTVILFSRVGDANWTVHEEDFYVDHVTSNKGKIYGVCEFPTEGLCMVEIEIEPTYSVKAVLVGNLLGYRPIGCKTVRRQLVESCGELLIFHMCFAGCVDGESDNAQIIMKIKVFRVDPKTMGMEELNDLGDRAFFLDICLGGFGCCATKCGLKKNHIYFTCGNPADYNLYIYDYREDIVSSWVYGGEFEDPLRHELVMCY